MRSFAMLLSLAMFTTIGLLSTHARGQVLVSADIHAGFHATVNTPLGSNFKGDINAAGQNSTDDQIGVWDNGSAASNWWNYTGYTMTDLVDANGSATGISVAITGAVGDAANWNNAGYTTPNDDLVTDGIYSGETSALTTTISGLIAGGQYDLLVYHADDYVSEVVTVNGQAASDYTGPLANPGYSDAFDALVESDFWFFQSLHADANGELAISSGGGSGVGFGSANTITGFQLIQTPEPTSLFAWLFAGAAALGYAVWKRRTCS